MSSALSTVPAFGLQEVNGSPQISSRMRQRMVLSCAAAASPNTNNWEAMFSTSNSNSSSSKVESPSEASSLIALCEDLDWEACVNALRREASAALVKRDEIEAMKRRKLAENNISGDQEWDYTQAVSELRKLASFQAAEELSKKLDLKASVSGLADHIFLTACQMSEDQGGGNGSICISKAAAIFFSIIGGLQGWALANAETIADTSNTAVAPTLPSWFVPALLGFPVVSYLVFSVYRDKVNPQAKVMDFLFAMAALFIVGNLVTSATLGVRLY